jgi:hypothetical protein
MSQTRMARRSSAVRRSAARRSCTTASAATVPAEFRRRSALFAAEITDLSAEQEVVWVYAVAAGLDPGQLSGLSGVGGEPVRAVAEAGLHAVVGSVDAGAFGESSIASMLGDLANIEAIGRAHHEVVASIAAESPVVPLRLATVYPDDGTVGMLLAEHGDELAELIESLRGTQEWGVQVYWHPDQDLTWLDAEATAEAADEALSDVALAARRQPAPYLRPGSTAGWMVLNGIYLVDAGQAGLFASIAQHFAAGNAALRVEVTGPWPPYSFADRQEA